MSSPSSSYRAVVVALTANAFVAAMKFVAFALSGSGAMLSEAVHSAADTGNQALLFLGLVRAGKTADEKFHYGYGGERFIFGLLSASGIFFVGAGVTIYHGVSTLLEPHPASITRATWIILASSFCIEGGVFAYALRGISRERGKVPFFRFVRRGADPAAVAILLEDGAAVLGMICAALGILASYLTGDPIWDSVASIVVGVVLALIALYLIRENRELLLGRSVPEGVEDRFVAILERQPSVRAAGDVKTRQLTPQEYILKAEISFDEQYVASKLERALGRGSLEGARRGRVLMAVAREAIDLMANEIQAIEQAVRAEIPQAKHIDLEVAHPEKWEEEEDEDEEDAPDPVGRRTEV